MRFFSHAQKQILFTRARGMCQQCHIPLPKGWHADHIIPYSKGGETYSKLIGDLREKLKVLADKIAIKVFEYEFLKQ